MTNSPAFWIGYIVLIFAFMYFIAIRPQQKEKKAKIRSEEHTSELQSH